jgi:hypothetical protein
MKRWIGLMAIVMVVTIPAVIVSRWLRPTSPYEDYERIQLGMTLNEVDGIMNPWNVVCDPLGVRVGEDATTEVTWGTRPSIVVKFENGRVVKKDIQERRFRRFVRCPACNVARFGDPTQPCPSCNQPAQR